MTILLLDASVWLAALDPRDRFGAAARQVLARAGGGGVVLAALDLTFYEIANVMVRWRRADVGVQCRHIEIARGRRVARAEHSLMREASELAREHGLTAYDAAYVSAARRHGWTLVSSDVADLVSPGFALSPDAAIGA